MCDVDYDASARRRSTDQQNPPGRALRTRVRQPLVIFCGVPGSGKTTIARILSEKLRGSVHIQTDTIRGMIARRKYDGPESAFVYDSCVQVARVALKRGRPAILDGTFARRAHRARAIATLRGLYGRYLVVYAVCSISTAERRNSFRKEPVPLDRLRAISASFEEPAGALRIDTEVRSAEESALIVFAAATHGSRSL